MDERFERVLKLFSLIWRFAFIGVFWKSFLWNFPPILKNEGRKVDWLGRKRSLFAKISLMTTAL